MICLATNLNFRLKKLETAKTWSEIANFTEMKLVLATKPAILNKMA